MSNPDTRAGVDGLNQDSLVKTELQQPEASGFFGRNRFFTDLRAKSLNSVCALLVAGLSIPLISTLLEKGNVQAKEPHFPDPAPKKLLATEDQIITDYGIERLHSYVDASGNNYFVGLGVIPPDYDHERHAVLGKFDSNGKLSFRSMGKIPFFALDVAGSPIDQNIAVGVGDQQRGADKGMVWLTKDGGQTSQVIDRSANGTMFDVQNSPDGRYEYISQRSAHAENSTIIAQLDLLDVTIIDQKILDTFGSFSGLSQMLFSPDGRYTNYGLLPLNWGFFRITYQPSLSISPQLGPNQYLLGRLTTLIDSENRDVVLGFTNFTGDPVAATAYKYRYDRSNGQQIDSASFQQLQALYPPQPTIGRFLIGAVAGDVISNTILMGGGVEISSKEAPGFKRFPFIESASLISPTNALERYLLPTSGDWPAEGTLHIVDVAKNGNNRYWLASIGSMEVGVSGLLACDIAACVWEKAPLIIPESPLPTPTPTPYKLYLPSIQNSSN